MKKSVWLEGRWKDFEMCHNGSANNNINFGRGIGVSGQCYDNPAINQVTVIYDEDEHGSEYDTFDLCADCTKRAKKEFRGRYKCKVEKINYDDKVLDIGS
jgi:hypothetical protein